MRITTIVVTMALMACRNDKPSADTATMDVDPLNEDLDGDGYTAAEDCDDNNSLVYPGASETCDGADNNCDGEIDEGVTTTFYEDSDDDGFGNPDQDTQGCEAPSGYVSVPNDCNDDNAETYPGAAERCDGEDNDCDGEIDEGVTTVWYADADGDQYGDPDSALEECDPPDGYVADDTDCNDLNSTAYPGATEICDGADNNCDGDVDEGVTTTYYTDSDNDNYGVAESTTEACFRPNGYAVQSGDCEDGDATINPSMTELCDGVDNDCDGYTDEDDAADASTWYADDDTDGYGDASDTAVACDQPSGRVADSTDCNDATASANPGQSEVCDGIDNDCDGDTDEATATDASTWYADSDGDGYGTAVSTVACEMPTGYADNSTDCDDGEPLSNPGETEVCDEIDNDCDGDTDEGVTTTYFLDYDGDGFGGSSISVSTCSQPSGYTETATDCDDGNADINPDGVEVCNSEDDDCDGDIDEDPTDADIWYADGDGDGYGNPDDSTLTCEQPSGYIADAEDCDDGEADINPGATEICDGVDNDCDGDIDNDAVDADTWYADSDGDGYGDPDDSTQTCEQPSGYVDNDEDCDVDDGEDIDGDGLQNCEDDDIDGDGLRNDWDADPEDDTVVRPPTAGLGTDGDLTVSGEQSISEWTLLDGGALTGDESLAVEDASGFVEGDELLVISQQGADAGVYESVMVADADGTTVDIEPPLQNDYDSSSVVLVYRVPHYGDVTVQSGGVITGDDWTGSGGGVVMFRATGSVSISGSVLADGIGFAGGAGVYGNDSDPEQGESHPGPGSTGDTTANGGGGGAHPRQGDNGDSGGGGSYGSQGSDGTNYYGSDVCDPGDTYGDTTLATWFLGSGGGGGSPDTEGDGDGSSCYAGDGGAGGGLIGIFVGDTLSIAGTVSANGSDGVDAVSPSSSQGEVGGGGGGSGGQLYLAAPTITISGTVEAAGGSGGLSASYNISTPYGSAYGGDGGNGRVRLDYDSLSGSPTTAAGYTSSFED